MGYESQMHIVLKSNLNPDEYWYLITIYTCPVCGRRETSRERMYGKKPKELIARRRFVQEYDYCQEEGRL